jgi:hypothetical protein
MHPMLDSEYEAVSAAAGARAAAAMYEYESARAMSGSAAAAAAPRAKKARRLTGVQGGRGGKLVIRAQAPEIVQLDAAIREMADAERTRVESKRLRAQAEAKHNKALQLYRAAVPAVESMVQSAAKTMTEHAAAAPAAQAAHADAERDTTQAAGKVRDALGARFGTRADPDGTASFAAVQRAGSELLIAAQVVDHHLEQLHATLAASSGSHNDGKCLCLQVLSIDQVRAVVMANLSYRQLRAVRRVNHDFLCWSLAETAAVLPLPLQSKGSAQINWSSHRAPAGSTIDVLDVAGSVMRVAKSAMPGKITFADARPEILLVHDIAFARGEFGVYAVGGYQRMEDGKKYDLVHPCVWRPAAGGGGGWHSLPPMPAARSDPVVCAVTMPEGDEAVSAYTSISPPFLQASDWPRFDFINTEIVVAARGVWGRKDRGEGGRVRQRGDSLH